MSTDPAEPDVQTQLQALRERYSEALPQRLSHIDAHWQQLCRNGWSEALAQALLRELHSLAGGAATFGYPELGQTARAMEYQLQRWLEQGGLPRRLECESFRDRIQVLRQQAGVRPTPATPLSDPPA